ncbi:uncharacterized protein LOC108906944 [Anoplophora glabripennis]|uniref:uncharacterized protein LOC108906944 n=1 Tax=Anoplophora glabripennis TaxID=217634 RepID=UPI000875A3F0|nr:uncharacterized protein LOC108906944 [Anoplophora glabripennis]
MRTFGISPNSASVVLQIDAGIIPRSQIPFEVYNIGRTPVYAETIYGTKISWLGSVSHADVLPGETKVLPNQGRSYYVLGLKIHNKTNVRAIISIDQSYPAVSSHDDGGIDMNYSDILKSLVAAGVKFTPTVGSTLSDLVKTFWPENKPSIWQQIKDKVSTLIDSRILQTVNGILSGDIRHYKERISVLMSKLDEGQNSASHYMNIAEDLVGFENKFSFDSGQSDYKQVNVYLLPLYSTLVLMKVKYYVYGLRNAQKIGLTQDNLADLRRFTTRLIKGEQGVNNYINAMYKERVDNAYATTKPSVVYDTMMSVRTFIAVNGLEYIPVWNSLVEKQTDDNVYNDAISYSGLYGSLSTQLNKEAIPEVLSQPLTPHLVNGRRNKLVSVEVYIWRINNGAGVPKIGGLKLVFENNDTYTMGTTSWEVSKVDFKGAILNRLMVTGYGALDRLTFYFSDGRQITVGTDDSRSSTTFELEGHHIVSMILTSDDSILGGQAQNIAVSYQPNGS